MIFKKIFILGFLVGTFFLSYFLITNQKKEYVLLEEFYLNGSKSTLVKDLSPEENILLIPKNKKEKKNIYSLKKKDSIPENLVDIFPFKGSKSDYLILVTEWKASGIESGSGYSINIINPTTGENINLDDKLLWFGKWLKDEESIDEYIPYNSKAKEKILSELEKLKKNGVI